MVIVNTLLLSLWKKCRSGSSSSNNNYAGVAISKEEKEEEKQPLTLAAAAGGTVILLAMFALLYVAVEVIKEIVLQRNVKLLLWVAATRLLVDLFFRKQHPKKTDESSNNNNEDSTTGTSSSLKQATHIDDKSNATASAATLFLKEDTASLVLSRTSGNERCEVGFETKEEKMDTDARKEDTEAAAAAMVVLPKDPNHAAPRSLFVSFGILFQNLQSALSGIVVRRRGGQPSAFESASGHDEMSITQTWTSSSITTNPKPQEKSKQLQSPDWQSFAMTMPPVSSNKNKWGIFGTSRGTIPVPKLSTAVVLLEGVAVAASAALLVAAFAAGLPVWLCDTAAALLTWSLGSSVYDKIVQVWGWRSSTRRDPSFSLTLEETMERLRETALWNSYTTTATIGNLTTTSTKQQSFYPGNQMLLQKPQLAWETIVQFVVAQGGSRDREETHTLNTPQVLETSMMTTSPSALAAAKNKNKNHAQFLTVEVTAPTCSNTTASYDSSLDTDYADVSVVQTQYYLEQPVRLLRAIVGGAFASPPPTRSNATAANETTTSSPDPASDNGSDDRL